jgi:hypothetical protein
MSDKKSLKIAKGGNVGGFLWALRLPPPIKLTATI